MHCGIRLPLLRQCFARSLCVSRSIFIEIRALLTLCTLWHTSATSTPMHRHKRALMQASKRALISIKRDLLTLWHASATSTPMHRALSLLPNRSQNICVYTHTHIHTHMHACMHTYYISLPLSLALSLYVCIYCTCVCVCVCVNYVCVCVCVYQNALSKPQQVSNF